MKNIAEVKKQIVPDKYACDKCGKNGDQTNMVFLGVGKLYHAKCAKKP